MVEKLRDVLRRVIRDAAYFVAVVENILLRINHHAVMKPACLGEFGAALAFPLLGAGAVPDNNRHHSYPRASRQGEQQ